MTSNSKFDALHVFKRSNAIRDLLNDDSIEIVNLTGHNSDSNHKSLDFISDLPASIQCKEILNYYTNIIPYSSLLRLFNPTFLICDWGGGDRRYFLISNNGTLIEDPFQSFWDTSFPFIHRGCSPDHFSLSFRLDNNITSTHNIKHPLIFFPHVSNYSHFLLDAFSNLSIVLHHYSPEFTLPYRLPIINPHETPSWQFEWISYFLKTAKVNMLPFFSYSQLTVVSCPEVLMPLSSSPMVKTTILRTYIDQFRERRASIQSKQKKQIIFFDRSDSRRGRIKNADQLKTYVSTIGGIIVDPSKLTFNQKLNLLSTDSIVIAESSGCMNSNIFSNERSFLIFLTDCESYSRPDLAISGWSYYLASGPKILFLVGEEPEPIHGSTLSSCTYSIEKLHKILQGIA